MWTLDSQDSAPHRGMGASRGIVKDDSGRPNVLSSLPSQDQGVAA